MIHVGDCLDILPTLPERSVHCVVTSPPYFGLRDYGVDGQIGLEPTPDAFVAAMVRVFREVKRVLRDDGCLWLNLGDSFNSSSQHNHGKGGKMEHNHLAPKEGWAGHRPMAPGLKPKDLIGIPWRVAFALQADGWYLRSDIIWHKNNPMPESVRDRPTKSHEYMFLLTKSPRYYWDAEAVKEENSPNTHAHGKNGYLGKAPHARVVRDRRDGGATCGQNPAGRNIRSVWTISTRPFKGAHFATFPPALVTPCIKAGTSERGCCPGCKKPWVRVVERKPSTEGRENWAGCHASKNGASRNGGFYDATSTTTGWRPDCECHGRMVTIDPEPDPADTLWTAPRPYKVYVPEGPQPDPIPCTVLDPFSGAGTVGVVAKQLGRDFLGIELNPEYAAMAEARIAKGA